MSPSIDRNGDGGTEVLDITGVAGLRPRGDADGVGGCLYLTCAELGGRALQGMGCPCDSLLVRSSEGSTKVVFITKGCALKEVDDLREQITAGLALCLRKGTEVRNRARVEHGRRERDTRVVHSSQHLLVREKAQSSSSKGLLAKQVLQRGECRSRKNAPPGMKSFWRSASGMAYGPPAQTVWFEMRMAFGPVRSRP
jgi:hypothetical protein